MRINRAPLAHPLRRQIFEEWIATLRYQITPKIHFKAQAVMA